MAKKFTRIPTDITDERDRRDLCAILTAYGLEVHIVKEKNTNRGVPKRYVEYRDCGLRETKIVCDREEK